jgi:hypothetical protein
VEDYELEQLERVLSTVKGAKTAEVISFVGELEGVIASRQQASNVERDEDHVTTYVACH